MAIFKLIIFKIVDVFSSYAAPLQKPYTQLNCPLIEKIIILALQLLLFKEMRYILIHLGENCCQWFLNYWIFTSFVTFRILLYSYTLLQSSFKNENQYFLLNFYLKIRKTFDHFHNFGCSKKKSRNNFLFNVLGNDNLIHLWVNRIESN